MSDVRDLFSLFIGQDAVPEATVAFLRNTDTEIRALSQRWSNKIFKLHSTPEDPSDSSTYNVDWNAETDQWVECSPSSIFPLPIARFTGELLRTRGPIRLFEDDPAVTALVSSSRLPPLEDEVEAETALIPLTKVNFSWKISPARDSMLIPFYSRTRSHSSVWPLGLSRRIIEGSTSSCTLIWDCLPQTARTDAAPARPVAAQVTVLP